MPCHVQLEVQDHESSGSCVRCTLLIINARSKFFTFLVYRSFMKDKENNCVMEQTLRCGGLHSHAMMGLI
jgi:hypothetical protein